MGKFMKDSEKTTKQMDLASTNIVMEQSMKVIGLRICSMDKELKNGRMGLITKAGINTE